MHEQDPLLAALEENKLLRMRDLEEVGVSRSSVRNLLQQGKLVRVARGVYSPVGREPEPHESLAEVSLRYPKAVVCLLSAARLHELTTANTPSVWIALPHGSRKPENPHVSLNVKFWRNPLLFSEGVEEVDVAGVRVRVTSPARTVVDLFRSYNRITDERCNEALWQFIEEGEDMDELHRLSRMFGVAEPIDSCVSMAICRI